MHGYTRTIRNTDAVDEFFAGKAFLFMNRDGKKGRHSNQKVILHKIMFRLDKDFSSKMIQKIVRDNFYNITEKVVNYNIRHFIRIGLITKVSHRPRLFRLNKFVVINRVPQLKVNDETSESREVRH